MKDVQAVFSKDLDFKPVSILRLKRCKLRFLSDPVLWNTTIKIIRSHCPFERMEDHALSHVETLKDLNLRYTKFSKIPKALSKLTKLRILHINDGKLTRIDTELRNMTHLYKLKMIHNHIFQISSGAFSGNYNLKMIDLSQNKLIFLHPGTFSSCRELTKIYLQKNSLNSVDGLFNISNLQEIYLKENNLKSIDDAFQRDIKLEILDLNSNPLKQISNSAFNTHVKQLRILILSRCELTFLLPTVFRSLSKLEKLDLSFNHLESLPVEIFHGLYNLIEVDLKENQMTYLGEVFSYNYRLESIMLSSNNLHSVENIFHGLGYLKSLDLRYNKLRVITETDFSTTLSMQSLQLTKNNIYRIDSNAFLNLAELRNLSLDYNKLMVLNGSLRNTPELQTLSLHHNRLQVIDASEMSNLKKLKILNLSYNNLTNVHKAFENLAQLEFLNMNNNKLTTISRSTFPPRISIKKLFVGANRWICDCRLFWLLENEGRTSAKFANRFKCITPEKFFKKKVSHLTTKNLTVWTERCDSKCQCTCVPQEDKFFVRVDCSSRNLTQVPAVLPEEIGELHLQNNLLSNPINLNIHSLSRLRYLDVEQNFLTKIDFYLPKNLKTLKLARNKLVRFISYFPSSILTWTLSGNPWICDCETIQFWKFLTTESKKILDVNTTKCSQTEGKPDLYGKIICELTEHELCPEKLRLYILLGVGLSVLTLTAIGCHIVYTRYRYHLKVWLYSRGFSFLKKRDDRDAGKKHDAYICFSDKDLEFVREHIIPELEEKEPFYSLFVPPRDMQAGKFELDHQLEEVRNSKRIIIVLSQNFIESELCMEIFRVAFASGLEEKHYRIIPMVVSTLPPLSELDPSLKVALESTKCLKFGQKLLWEMVRFAMPDKSRMAEASGTDDDIDMPLLNAW
ncbi:Protein toll like protein [Argiope bruennichi]|uniref:Protein toll like protein n=1 Tax=Argiope bruennichi TaxID=94029 RepID=A0A8T0EXW6_ARGBR|nr:Protein toll like protein [Argiope bruennichi]